MSHHFPCITCPYYYYKIRIYSIYYLWQPLHFLTIIAIILQGVLSLHKGGRRETCTDTVGVQDALWAGDGGVWGHGQWRVGPQCLLLRQWKPTGLGEPWQHCDSGGPNQKLNVSLHHVCFRSLRQRELGILNSRLSDMICSPSLDSESLSLLGMLCNHTNAPEETQQATKRVTGLFA